MTAFFDQVAGLPDGSSGARAAREADALLATAFDAACLEPAG